MGNRHAHKKLRAEARARMAATGEGYQQALARILAERIDRPAARRATRDVDLVTIDYFGVSAVLATFEIAGQLSVLVVSNRAGFGPFPRAPLLAMGPRGSRAVH